MKNIILGICKGRIFLESIFYLKFKKIFILENIFITRKLFLKTNKKNLYIIIIRNSDINYYIKNNIIDLFILGKDILIENNINFFLKIFNLNFSKSKIFLLTNKFFKDIYYMINKKLKIFSKYTNISNKYLMLKNINFTILKLNGSIELSLILKKSDIAIDILGTGKTCKDNNLFEIEKIVNLNANLVTINHIICLKFFFIFKNILKLLLCVL